ncbi:hypothetical protein [Pedobacter agri]|uniref:hypothetical protein n=1 Tax=Pedobacter agri TaxID=454586 RepID=UPI00292CD292|nr:hypothetical protein [Pedobacter agri]
MIKLKKIPSAEADGNEMAKCTGNGLFIAVGFKSLNLTRFIAVGFNQRIKTFAKSALGKIVLWVFFLAKSTNHC